MFVEKVVELSDECTAVFDMRQQRGQLEKMVLPMLIRVRQQSMQSVADSYSNVICG